MAEQKGQKRYEEIAARMLAQIQDGELRPGDRLPPERALAEEYGVSRTAIREALRSLEMMGCVESHVGEGTFIKAPSLSNIIDPFSMIIAQNGRMGSELIEVRLILETEIAALAARRRTDDQHAATRRQQHGHGKQQRKAGLPQMLSPSLDFHAFFHCNAPHFPVFSIRYFSR